MDGWIKLHRKILNSDMYRDLTSKQRDVLHVILLMANHREREWMYKGEIHTAYPGQMVTSLESIRRNCAKDVTVQAVRNALNKLEKWGFITNTSTKTGRVITVVNWGIYQGSEDDNNKDNTRATTKQQQRSNKETTPNKNVKNDKNEKKKKTCAQKKSAQRSYADDSLEMQLSKFMVSSIQQWNPEFKVSNIQRWCYEFHLILNRDLVSAEVIKSTVAWAAAHQFWRANILSPSKLRKQFQTLRAQIVSDKDKIIPMPVRQAVDEANREAQRIRDTKLMYEWIAMKRDPEDKVGFNEYRKKRIEEMKAENESDAGDGDYRGGEDSDWSSYA